MKRKNIQQLLLLGGLVVALSLAGMTAISTSPAAAATYTRSKTIPLYTEDNKLWIFVIGYRTYYLKVDITVSNTLITQVTLTHYSTGVNTAPPIRHSTIFFSGTDVWANPQTQTYALLSGDTQVYKYDTLIIHPAYTDAYGTNYPNQPTDSWSFPSADFPANTFYFRLLFSSYVDSIPPYPHDGFMHSESGLYTSYNSNYDLWDC